MKVVLLEQLLKIKEYLLALFISALSIITPAKAFIITISLFVFMDTILAIYYNIKTKGMSSFKANKFFNIAPKTFFYMGSIIMAFLIDKFIFENSLLSINLFITKIITILFIWIELKSIDETLIKLGNKSMWVHLKEIFKKGKEFKKNLNNIIEDENK